MKESDLQVMVADYLRLQYPDVLFHSDFGSGIKLTMGQATKQKRQNGGRRAWPDMLIAEPRFASKIPGKKNRFFKDLIAGREKFSSSSEMAHSMLHCGLFLELKKEGTKIMKKGGGLVSNPHIIEQSKMLNALNERGYYAVFAVGFDEAKRIIDEYLGGKE